MAAVFGILVALGLGLWFGRRLGPALLAALVVLTLPLWLVGGALLDVGRRAWSAVHPRPPKD